MARRNRVSWHQPPGRAGRWRFTRVGPSGKREWYYADPEIPGTEAGRRRATAWMEGLLAELARREPALPVDPRLITVEMLRLVYLDWVKARADSEAGARLTYDTRRRELSLICRTTIEGRPFGDRVAVSLTRKDASTLVRSWVSKSTTTIRNRLSALLAMLNWADEARDDRPIPRIIPANPLAGYELPRLEYQGDRYAPAAEIEAFLDWVEAREASLPRQRRYGRFAKMTALLLRMVAETGCRPGEACVMRWEHFHPGERAIILPPELHKTGRKTGRPRFIILSPETAEAIGRLREDPDAHPEFIFTHTLQEIGGNGPTDPQARRRGVPWTTRALSRRMRALRAAAVAAGVPVVDSGVRRMHLYRLRHSRITRNIQQGINIADVAGMSGNSIQQIEKTYLQHQLGHLREALDRAASPGRPPDDRGRAGPDHGGSQPTPEPPV